MNTMHASTSFLKEDTLKTKAFAVVLLLFHHLFYTDGYINTYNIHLPRFLDVEHLLRLGVDARVCVWIFVFLSAYGVTIKLSQNDGIESAPRTIFKQWWSLMKPYWFIYMVCIVMFSKNIFWFHEGKLFNIAIDFFGYTELLGMIPWTGSWWYICFAQILLFALPLLLAFIDKVGVFSIPISYLLIQFVNPGIRSEFGGYYSAYVYAALLAILCKRNDWFGLLKKKHAAKVMRFMESSAWIAAFLLFAHWKVSLSSSDFKGIATISTAFSAFALCVYVQKYLSVSWLDNVLTFIGKHSGNIYLIHTLVYSKLDKIVFCTKTILGSMLILLGICLLISIIIEKMKELLRYNQIMDRILVIILKRIPSM